MAYLCATTLYQYNPMAADTNPEARKRGRPKSEPGAPKLTYNTKKKKRTVKMEAPVTAVQAVERIYGHMITDLKSAIEASTADNSIRGFVLAQQDKYDADPTDPTAHTFEIRNLYRVFSLDNPQRMSLNLYIKLCQALGIGGARMRNNPITPGSNETLVDYLAKDFDIIWKTVLNIQYQGA